MKARGRIIYKGVAEGIALVSKEPIGFLGGIDPKTGKISDEKNPLFGQSVKNKIFVFPKGKGSTVGSYVLYQLKKNNAAPKGMINIEAEPIVAVGAIISEIPLVDKLGINPIDKIKTGDKVKINGENVEVIEK